jgi:beta-glucosidase
MMKHIIKSLSFCLLLLPSVGIQGQKANSVIENKVESLLSKMTLEEKLGQMEQISSTGNIDDMSGRIRMGQIGSILNETDPNRINILQHVAVKESRLGIPLLIARDVIHGYKTILPIPLGQAATFDPEVVEQGARIAASEASSVGIKWTFAPMLDISRDPRWGRVAEGCGEDPYLTSVMGSAMIRGFQGKLSDPSSIAACAKHFVGYGAVEGGRDYNSTYIPERLMRNVYFPPFEAAVKAGVSTFMTSFNSNDGIPSTGNSFILRKVLRNEWNFDGLTVSDWTSIAEMITHGFAADGKDAAMKAMNSGVDMDMESHLYISQLPDLIKEGKVDIKTIDNAVRNILRIKFRLGLFDHPYVDRQTNAFYTPANLAVAKQAAIESAILLKNVNQTLPLGQAVHTVAIVGPMADAPYEQMGTWVFDGEKSHTQTPLNAIKALVGNKVHVIYEPALAYSRDTTQTGIDKAVAAAEKADAVIAFVGEESILSGEAHCLANLNLQGAQSKLITELAKTGKPVITVVMAGRPLTLDKEVKESSAVIYQFHPGTMGGPAIADILWGNAVPSGKVPMTFPKEVGQIPIYYAHDNTGRPATRKETLLNKIPVEAGQTSLGCTSFYLDAGFDPLFPFGYGLSYTIFKYGNIHLSSTDLQCNDTLQVSFDLTNSGKFDAAEVPQLYVGCKSASVTRPVKELKRFMRVMLKQGETKHLCFSLPVKDLAFYGMDMNKDVESGNYRLWVGTDSQSGNEFSFHVMR